MSYISIEELNERLESPSNLLNRISSSRDILIPQLDKVLIPTLVRESKATNIPPIFRELVGVAGALDRITGGTSKSTAEAFSSPSSDPKERSEISSSVVRNYREGLLARGSKQRKVDPFLTERIEENLNKVRDRVLDRMVTAIGYITNEKLENRDAKELSLITSNLSRVLGSTAPREDSSIHVDRAIFITPEQAREDSYELVKVG